MNVTANHITWPMSPQGYIGSSLYAITRFWSGMIPKKLSYNKKNPLKVDENWLQQMLKPIFNLLIWEVDESDWLNGTMFYLLHLWGVFHIFGFISKHVFDLEIKNNLKSNFTRVLFIFPMFQTFFYNSFFFHSSELSGWARQPPRKTYLLPFQAEPFQWIFSCLY